MFRSRDPERIRSLTEADSGFSEVDVTVETLAEMFLYQFVLVLFVSAPLFLFNADCLLPAWELTHLCDFSFACLSGDLSIASFQSKFFSITLFYLESLLSPLFPSHMWGIIESRYQYGYMCRLHIQYLSYTYRHTVLDCLLEWKYSLYFDLIDEETRASD